MSPSPPSADRNLLFGLLALQMDFVTRGALLDAMHAWLLRKGEPLGSLLVERGALAERERELVERLVEAHLARHGGDARKGVATVRVGPEVAPELACVADDEVRASIASLFTPTDDPGSMAPLPAPAVVPAGGPSRFRKLRTHARGGLGEVFVALDRELGREIALKEIRPEHADRADLRARFVREAEVTGTLEHPGIVPVHGLGCYEDGRPFYAMRFVRGESLHDAIRRFHEADEGRRGPGERELALRGLLTRFVAVCNAVAFAHSRGVVHRDLKPDNVMLGEYGETLLVDWGLAKVLRQPEGQTAVYRSVAAPTPDAVPTELGQAVGTPAFMPPEQARGEWDRVGPASDVFSLGATLYCLLTGRSPYQGSTASLLAAAAEAKAPPARRVNARVPAALEAVCHRAMAPRPEDRYPSARALAAEVERWLADEPVAAYRDPLSQRLRRWSKRHRTAVASGLVLLVASVVGLALGLGAVRAEQARTAAARDRAEEAEGVATARLAEAETNLGRALKAEEEAKRQLTRAEDNLTLAKTAVDDFFGIAKKHNLLSKDAHTPALRRLRKELLEKALPFYQNFRVQRPGRRDALLDVWEQHAQLGYIQSELGNARAALAQYQSAEEAIRRLARAEPGDLDHQIRLSRTLVSLGGMHQLTGDYAKARDHYAEAVRVSLKVSDAQPDRVGPRADLVLALANLGNVLAGRGTPRDALKTFEVAIAVCRRLVRAGPDQPSYRADLAAILEKMGKWLHQLARRDEALRCLTEAVQVARELAGTHPDDHNHRRLLAMNLSSLAELQVGLGKRSRARRNSAEAVELLRPLARAHPDLPAYGRMLARALLDLGSVQLELGERDTGARSIQEAAGMILPRMESRADGADEQVNLAVDLTNLGRRLFALHRDAEGLKCMEGAARTYRALAKADPAQARHRSQLVGVLVDLATFGRDEGVEKGLTEAVDLGRGLVKERPEVPEHWLYLGRARAIRGMVYLVRRETKAGRQDLDEALTALAETKRRDPNNPNVAHYLFGAHRYRGGLLMFQRRYREALPDLGRAAELAPPDQLAGTRALRARCLVLAGEHDRAAAEAVDVARVKVPATALYEVARVFALSAAGASRDRSRPLPVRERLAESRARQALAALRRLAAGGALRAADLDRDSNFDFLRGRDDYKRFRGGLGGKRP